MDRSTKTDEQVSQMIANHERAFCGRDLPQYPILLEECARRAQLTQKLNLEKSMDQESSPTNCVWSCAVRWLGSWPWAKTTKITCGADGSVSVLCEQIKLVAGARNHLYRTQLVAHSRQ